MKINNMGDLCNFLCTNKLCTEDCGDCILISHKTIEGELDIPCEHDWEYNWDEIKLYRECVLCDVYHEIIINDVLIEKLFEDI